jgi:hypothetical protein
MTDNKPFADRARDQTTAGNSPHAHRVSERRRRTDVAMKHFWPRKSCPRSQCRILPQVRIRGGEEDE